MTEKLAKQLKDAGFPQQARGKNPYEPGLGELIGACGKYFWSLRHTPDGKWLSSGRLAKKDNQVPYYESATYDEPEVAVAELFLAIKLHEQEEHDTESEKE